MLITVCTSRVNSFLNSSLSLFLCAHAKPNGPDIKLNKWMSIAVIYATYSSEKKIWKKFLTSRYRCSALPTELSGWTIHSPHIFPWDFRDSYAWIELQPSSFATASIPRESASATEGGLVRVHWVGEEEREGAPAVTNQDGGSSITKTPPFDSDAEL